MAARITRRDFLNGASLAVLAGVAPATQIRAAARAGYPPELVGLRGSTDAAFKVMHALAREGATFDTVKLEDEESYDLVVVGAGLAGLSAAWLYREAHPSARILILDNHDDFGGHARRNEFSAKGRLLLSYGGSESMVAPRSEFKDEAKRMFAALGLDPERFYDENVFHRRLYPGLGLSRGVFFAKESFGRDVLVTGDPMVLGYDEFAPDAPNSRPIDAFLADCPISDAAREGILKLFTKSDDFLQGKNADEKQAILKSNSYRFFIETIAKLPKDAGDFFQGRLADNFGLGIDAISAHDAIEGGLPGGKDTGVEGGHGGGEGEPYIHHFPDGNASIARLIVRALIDGVAPGRGMEDVVTAKFDYGKLDVVGSACRLRLEATAVDVRNEGGSVCVGYVKDGRLHRVRGSHAVVATYAMVMPHIVPELAEERKSTLASNVKAPLLYCKALVSDWQSFVKLGVHNIAAPMSFLTTVKLDYPVSLGSYEFPRDPSQPMVVHMVHVPLSPNRALDARTQCRIGRQWLLDTPFEAIERNIRSDLKRMLGPGGFDAERDIQALTVNRWSHGYSYFWSSLYDDVEAGEAAAESATKRVGNIVFANSDTAWDAYAHSAMAEAARAIAELTGE